MFSPFSSQQTFFQLAYFNLMREFLTVYVAHRE